MTTTERRQRDRDRVRQEILDATTRVLEREGAEGMSLRKVAAEAEYSPATVYLYFEGRDDLIRQWLVHGFGLFLARVEAIPSEVRAQAEPALCAFLHAYVAFALENPAAMRLALRPEVQALGQGPPLHDPAFLAAPGNNLLAGALRSQGLAEERVHLGVAALRAGIHGLVSFLLGSPVPEPFRSSLVGFHIRALVRGVLGDVP